MKRLFRTSKTTIDPLPPPTPPSADYAPHYQQQQLPPQAGGVKKSGSALRLEGHGHAPAESLGSGGKNWFGGSSAPSVTPFPVDVGHGGPMRRLSRKEKKERGSAPSMLEIQQMQQSPSVLQKPPPPPPPKMDSNTTHNPQSRFYETELASPDNSWTVLPPNQARHQPSPDHYSSRTHTPPLPIPSAPALQGSGGGSGRSSPNAQQLYLPPGARPPTPPAALRPATPNYNPMGQSQASLHSQQYEERRTRDRGYSSASGSMRGSDAESNTGHAAGPKPIKIASVQPMRSPLANSYASPPSFPTPQPHFQPPPAQYAPPEEDMRHMTISQQYEEPLQGKEKKKFWGMDMGWANKKDKLKEKDHLGVQQEQGRRSFDWSQAQDHSVGQTGYAVAAMPQGAMNMGSGMIMEDEQRVRMASRMFFNHENKDPSSAKDVSAAIQMLCAHPDPSFSAVYGVCDRMNHSEASETVCKDAARAIRKQFKHGNEAERRAAAVVWLLMMRNVPAVRPHAASKKVIACLEPILLAPLQKPLVNANTHRTITDILADLAYCFGGEKGCESLVELWRKVKMPQEPENGRPLPDDHHIFTPEAQYPTHIVEQRTHHSTPPRMQNGYDDHPPGPGYANLPSHSEDMRRLIEESTAGKEAARVLSEALVFSRPEELELKPIIREFYNKCFHAHESLTNQMDWAQAEASRSRERTMMNGLSLEAQEPRPGDTIEEQALSVMFDAHAALSEVIRQHDEMERMAQEQNQMSEVRERSKKETKMGRDDPSRFDQPNGFLSANQAQGSSSRSPSPAPNRLGASPRTHNLPLPPFTSERSRTPSPDGLPPPPRLSSSPSNRPASPLGRARGNRPLPNPFKTTGSSASLKSSSAGHSGFAVSNPDPQPGHDEDDEAVSVPLKPSRKALGKRRAQPVDPDNHFDPNDMFSEKDKKTDSASSEESVTVDDVFFHKPVEYAYDAYKEKLEREAAGGGGSGSGSSGYRATPVRREGGIGGSGGSGYGYGTQVEARA